MIECTPALLKTFEDLKDVPDDQLQWLIDRSDCRMYAAGDQLTVKGKPIAGPHFIISGGLRLMMTQNGSTREISSSGPGSITGYLPFSRAKVATVDSQAVGETQIMSFDTTQINEMIKTQFELTQALVHVMTNRVRNFTALQQQNEKMMALGKLSAGLAHELNNPASAIVRDSDSLLKHLQLQPHDFKSVIAIRMEPEQVDAVADKLFRVLSERRELKLTLRQRTEMEDDLNNVFDELGVENGMDI
ncbi:MAG: Crp/Fnr family transcriptional regulator, partial [Bacteroidetes bacterium]|nr:Crp/Fnr family transcriptional regulator [Bacteroidota bacterium]